MQYCIYYILDFVRAINSDNNEINLNEPFKGLFTQGMVCHQTYKDKKIIGLVQMILSNDGKDYFKNNQPRRSL